MIKSIILSILLFCPAVFADSVELIFGGLTYHTFIDPSVSNQFSNRLSKDGALIYNQLYGFGYTTNDEYFYKSYKVFYGHNSINEPMGGGLYSFGLNLDEFQLGLGFGGYFQDGSKFKQIDVELGDFMPLVGIEGSFKIMLSDTYFLKLNSFFGGIIFNETLSLGSEF